MFLTCLLNSSPPALNRNSFGILFHCFAAKYLKEFNPYFVVFTFGSDSVLLPLIIISQIVTGRFDTYLPLGRGVNSFTCLA